MIFFHVTQGSVLNYSMEFRGGTSVTVPFNEDYTIEELDAQVQPVIEEVTGDSNIQMTKIMDSNNVMIRTRSLSLEEREEVYASLEENFGVDSSQITFENISATISEEMSRNAAMAVVISILRIQRNPGTDP